MTTPKERLAIVRKIARRLLDKYGLVPPVDLESLAEKARIRIESVSAAAIDGYADLSRNIIYLSDRQTYLPRRRFTLAHEIGHILIPWHTDIRGCIIDSPYVDTQMKQKIDLQEYEANAFASELLIPSRWLREQAAGTADFKTLLGKTLQQTQASLMACLLALKNVLPAGHVICAKADIMDTWRFYRSPGTRPLPADPLDFLDGICTDKESFSIGGYQITHYRLPRKN